MKKSESMDRPLPGERMFGALAEIARQDGGQVRERQREELFPDSAYQLTHNALFPHDCIHVENLGGDIGLKELHNKRLMLGSFPWKFKGGEAAFSREVAFVQE
jgi:kynurenine formamidase